MSVPNTRTKILHDAQPPAQMLDPHQVTRDFEAALCEYTGAPFAVATTSCTMALLLTVAWHVLSYERQKWQGVKRADEADTLEHERLEVEIPSFTYVGVPQAIIHAGGRPVFADEEWKGGYQMRPLPVWDYARRFTSGMYAAGQMQCVSFHVSKILTDTQGGAILHDDPQADAWFRKARFDGRTEGMEPKDDPFDVMGWHAYLSPDVSARLLWKLSVLPRHNADLPNSDYPDLSTIAIFK